MEICHCPLLKAVYTIILLNTGIAMTDRIVSGNINDEDSYSEGGLRPRKLSDYVGQDKVKDNLVIGMDAAKQRGEPLDHVLLYGPPGLGKTTLARMMAEHVTMRFESLSAVFSGVSDLRKVFDQAVERKKVGTDTLLFVDEIHRFNRCLLYTSPSPRD